RDRADRGTRRQQDNSRQCRRGLTVAYAAGVPGRPPNRCTHREASVARRRRREPRAVTGTPSSDRGSGLPAPCRSPVVPVLNTLPPRKSERLVVAGWAIADAHAGNTVMHFGRAFPRGWCEEPVWTVCSRASIGRIVQEKPRLGLRVGAGASRLGLTPPLFWKL